MKIFDKKTGLEIKLALTQEQQRWNDNLGRSISKSKPGWTGIVDPPARPEQQAQPDAFDVGMKEWQAKAKDIWSQLGQYQKTINDISAEGKRLAIHVYNLIPSLNTMSKKLFGKDIIDPTTPEEWNNFSKQMDQWSAYLAQTQKRILAEGKMDFKETPKAKRTTEDDMVKHLQSMGYKIEKPVQAPSAQQDPSAIQAIPSVA